MKKAGANHEILHLLVSVYNQSIQTYYYFPEVILCDRQRLDREQFDTLLAADFVMPYKADSFGKYYRLSKKGEEYLLASSFRRRHKQPDPVFATCQPLFPFVDASQLHC